MDEYGCRIATSMADLEVGQVIASYSTVESMDREELVRAGRIVGFVGASAVVDNEVGETKKIGFRGDNTVFILAEAPEDDPAEAAWKAWNEPDEYGPNRGGLMHQAFIAGYHARDQVEST